MGDILDSCSFAFWSPVFLSRDVRLKGEKWKRKMKKDKKFEGEENKIRGI